MVHKLHPTRPQASRSDPLGIQLQRSPELAIFRNQSFAQFLSISNDMCGRLTLELRTLEIS